MRRLFAVFAALAISVSALACDSEPEGPAERGAEIARQIQDDPDNTEAILAEHDMTIDELEALMYEIAADPELSERYQELLEEED